MPTIRRIIVKDYLLHNDFGKAWGDFDFWVYGDFTEVKIHVRLHSCARNCLGAPSDCTTYVSFTSEKLEQVYGGGYFVSLATYLDHEYCTRREGTWEITAWVGGRNTVMITFDVPSWGLGGCGVVEILELIITYPEGSPEPRVDIQAKEYKTFEGAIKLLREFIVKIFMPMMMMLIMVSLIRAVMKR